MNKFQLNFGGCQMDAVLKEVNEEVYALNCIRVDE